MPGDLSLLRALGLGAVQTGCVTGGAMMAPGRKDGDRGVCLAEIQSKRQERKRRSTANPAYSGLLETEVRPPLQGGGSAWPLSPAPPEPRVH